MHDTVIKLLDEVKQLWMATDSLKAFTGWPDDLIASNSAPNPAPAAEKLWHGAHRKTARHRPWFMRFSRQHFM
jgi:hypothetical protein